MKFPKQFYIKGKRWRILIKEQVTLDALEVNGLCDFENRTVELSSNISNDEMLTTFIHEFTHALLYEAHITNHKDGVSPIVEEIICDSAADAFTECFELRWKK